MSKSLKQFFIGGLSLSAVNISGKIVNLLILPIITIYLSPSDFGVIAIYMLVISILGMLYNPGIISATLRLYYDNEADSDENKILIGSSVLFLLILPVFLAILSLFFGESLFNIFFKNFKFWPYGFFAVIASITPQITRLWSTLWVARQKTKRVAIISLIRIFLAISISLVLIVIFKMGAMGRILGLFIGNVVIFLIVVFDIFNFTKFKFSIKKLGTILLLGFPLVFSVFSYVIMDSSDKYMLEQMVSLRELGIYDIAYTYSAVPLFILVGFSQMWQPIFFENMKKGAYGNLLKLSGYYIVFLFLVSLSVIVFSNEVFNLFVDAEFRNAIKIIPWIVVGIFFLGLSNLIVSIYSYQKRFKEIGIISITAAIINVILNYLFIKSYGLVGAAIASAFTYSLYFLILLFKIRKDFTQVFSLKFFSLTLSILLITAMIFNYVNSSCLEFNLSIFFAKALAFIFGLMFLLFFGVIDYKDKLVIKRFFKR